MAMSPQTARKTINAIRGVYGRNVVSCTDDNGNNCCVGGALGRYNAPFMTKLKAKLGFGFPDEAEYTFPGGDTLADLLQEYNPSLTADASAIFARAIIRRNDEKDFAHAWTCAEDALTYPYFGELPQDGLPQQNISFSTTNECPCACENDVLAPSSPELKGNDERQTETCCGASV